MIQIISVSVRVWLIGSSLKQNWSGLWKFASPALVIQGTCF